MNRALATSLVAIGAALVAVAVAIFAIGRSDDRPPAETEGGPATLPSASADPFDFDASALDPAYVRPDAEIHLACGQLLGEAQIAAFLGDPIEAGELEVAQDLGGGFEVACDFTSDIQFGNSVRIDDIGAGETVAFCFEGDNDPFYEPDPAGPGDSYYDIDGSGFYRACLNNARLDITGIPDAASGSGPATLDDYRALAAYFAANQDKFALALSAA